MKTNIEIQPVFDPASPYAVLDRLRANLFLQKRIFSSVDFGGVQSQDIGRGKTFHHRREYAYGDDSKDIDWLATAGESGDTIIVRKNFKDVSPKLLIVTDMLQDRHDVGYPGHFSEQYLAVSAIASFMTIANNKNWKFGLVDAGTVGRRGLIGEGRRHSQRVIGGIARKMLDKTVERDDRLAAILLAASKVASNSLMVVVSDLRDRSAYGDDDSWGPELAKVRRNNQVIVVETTNPWDFELPEYRDCVGGSWIGSGKKGRAIRDRYAADTAKQQIEIDEGVRGTGARHIKLSTADGCWLDSLNKQFKHKH